VSRRSEMSDLLERIYKEIIYYEEDAVRMENELATEIDRLLVKYTDRLGEGQMVQFRAVIYEAVFTAEAKAFWLGIRYAFRLSRQL